MTECDGVGCNEEALLETRFVFSERTWHWCAGHIFPFALATAMYARPERPAGTGAKTP